MYSSKRTGASTRDFFLEVPDGYRETISEGQKVVGFLDRRLVRGPGSKEGNIRRLREAIDSADAIVVGAGSGLSTSAGFTYSGPRFMRYFGDFFVAYGITDMYSGGFYPFPEPEIQWAWWSRHIYFNRYVDAPKPVYRDLLGLLEGREYFVITTNVDHQFQRAGIDKRRLFYTQGDYGLLQTKDGRNRRTYDNEGMVIRMMESQGFVRGGNGEFAIPEGGVRMRVSTELIPRDETTGEPLVMNLRSDDSFSEDDGWVRASAAYSDFLRRHDGQKVLYMELGVGLNTPVIIKYPFWYRTWKSPKAAYACLNLGETFCPKDISDRSICIDGDLAETISALRGVEESQRTV